MFTLLARAAVGYRTYRTLSTGERVKIAGFERGNKTSFIAATPPGRHPFHNIKKLFLKSRTQLLVFRDERLSQRETAVSKKIRFGLLGR